MSRQHNKAQWSLVGIPDHQAVLNLGGRLGAAHGPKFFRRAFDRINGKVDVRAVLHDAGDAGPMGSDIPTNHKIAADRVHEEHSRHGLSVVIGGSHDHGHSHLMGVAAALGGGKAKKKPALGCINIDAHLDVRKPSPLITSGSPFYLALEAGVIEPERFVEFAVQRHCNAPVLWDYIAKKGVRQIPFSEIRRGNAVKAFRDAIAWLSSVSDSVVVSLDLDAIASAHAPGVSAPQPQGLTGTEAIEIMEIAGADPKVASLGVFELNPEHDADGATARLAAECVYYFVEAALTRPA